MSEENEQLSDANQSMVEQLRVAKEDQTALLARLAAATQSETEARVAMREQRLQVDRLHDSLAELETTQALASAAAVQTQEELAAAHARSSQLSLELASSRMATSKLTSPEASDASQPAASDSVPTAARDAVEAVVDGWAQAWMKQQPDELLLYYSRDFVPQDGSSRAAWQSQRRARISSPNFIQVSISELRFQQEGRNKASVRFTQDYESDTYSDSVDKLLELTREDGSWKIVAERVLAPPSSQAAKESGH